MKKYNFIALLLSALFLFSCIYVSADELPIEEITISNAEEFLKFAENCNIDSYSRNVIVSLSEDLDLTGYPFSGIAIFCGTFDGNGHTISNVTLDYTGSTTGLFRYITDGATVKNLKISGVFSPKGSAMTVGGIAGSNAGTIKNCTFTGTASGTDHIGGIAGINTETGVIDSCTAEGVVYGDHFTGGITGSNNGIIKNCINKSMVNTQVQQNKVDLSQITLDAITGTELAATVTDIGGIAGISSGVIAGCKNYGDIGYLHMGYNIGGIAGSQTGYIYDCMNSGTISGRKEIGGIVGQLEPVIAITYSTDTLQILQGQLNTLSGNIKRAAGHIDSTISGIKSQLTIMKNQVADAATALENLMPNDGNSIPSEEDFSNIIQTLQNTASTIGSSLENVYDSLQYADSTLSKDMDNISASLAAMEQTLSGASAHLGGSVTDHSDEDTEDDLTAKISKCQNQGAIYADLSGGGIAGAIAFESDLDPEADIDIFGDFTLNFAGAYRAVITDCENTAPVSVKKQYGGGIVGYATLGLVRRCDNLANLICENATYVGGIAGRSNGQIRNCNAKCMISAVKLAGGIAGQGKTVSDCLALSSLTAGEKTGAILGFAEDLAAITNNFYMITEGSIGAVDGISYENTAHPLSVEEFLQLENLPEFFKSYTVTFEFPDSTTQKVILQTGQTLTLEQIPELPELNGCMGSWENHLSIQYFDTTITSTYEARQQVVQSEILRENGMPVLLAEGSFQPLFRLDAENIQQSLAENAIDGWHFTNAGISTVRYLPPQGYGPNEISIMVLQADGSWTEVPHTVSGSYAVFTPNTNITAFCIIPTQTPPWGLYASTACLLLLCLSVITIVAIKRKKGTQAQQNSSVSEV